MAEFSTPRQPRYTPAARRRPSAGGRPVSTRPPRMRRRGPAPILIILAIMAGLIFCWVVGRGCGGDKEAKENEKLRAYTTSANKVVARSASVGEQFDSLRKGVEDLPEGEISRKLTAMVGDNKDIAQQALKLETPDKAVDAQTLLNLSLGFRVSGVEKFRAGLIDAINRKNTTEASTMMTEGLMDLVLSDEIMERFRSSLESKLKSAKLTFEKVAASTFVPRKDDALPASVIEYVDELQGTEAGSEIHGVAVIGVTTTPARVARTESGLSVLPYSGTFRVKVTVQNQGNQEENDIPVVVTLTVEPDGTPQKQTKKITSLKPNEGRSLVFEGLRPGSGGEKENLLKVKAGPVKNEKVTDNNSQEIRFVMRAEGE